MDKNNKLLKGMAIGAMVGAAVSLLDRETRESTVANVRSCSGKLWNYARHPEETMNNLTNQLKATKEKIEEFSEDVLFIIDKAKDIKETTEKVQESSQSLLTEEAVEDR